MAQKWHGTKHSGVRYREHSTRKHGVKKDRYFALRYQKDGERVEEGLGWSTDGWTESKAALKLAELRRAAATGEGEARLSKKREKARQAQIEAERERLTFGRFFLESYMPISETTKKPESIRKEKEHFTNWLQEAIGDIPLKDVSPFHLEKIKKKMIDAGKSARMVQYVFATCRQCWNMARRDGLVDKESPTKSVTLPKVSNERIEFLSVEEADMLLDYLKGQSLQLHDIALLSLDTGARAGEIFNLRWNCIHFEDGTIDVIDGKSGDRTLYMSKRVKAMLERQPKGSSSSLVFRSRTGGKIKAVSNAFDRAVEALEFNKGVDSTDRKRRIVFHSLRHSFASWHAMDGTPLPVIQKLMGHKSFAMVQRYAKYAPDYLRQAAGAIDRIHREREDADVIELKKTI